MRGSADRVSTGSVADAVAAAAAAPLLLDSDGDPDVAWDRWLALRAQVDDAVARRLRDPHAGRVDDLLAALAESLATGHGDIDAMVRRAIDDAPDPLARADAQRALAKLGTWRGETLRTAALAERAAAEVMPLDRRRAAELRVDAATALLHAGHLTRAEEAARRAAATIEPDSTLATTSQALLGCVLAMRTPGAAVDPPDPSVLDALGPGDIRLGVLVGSLLVWAGRHDEARTLLGRSEAIARATAPDTLPYVLAAVADLDHRTGWWRSGQDAADEGEARSSRSRSRNVRALLLVRRARFDAALGDRASALARLAEADRIEQAAELLAVRMHAASVRALLATAEGDYESVLAHAEQALRVGTEMGLRHPGVDPVHGDLVEALVRTGQHDEAARVLDELEATAALAEVAPSTAITARGRLLLAPDEDLDARKAEALALHDAVPMPFERARTLMVLGERARRAGRRREARVVLTTAHAEFTRLGAQPWADRALAELRAAGGRVPTDNHDGALEVLSPQEQQVARAVADGATNQGAAAALFVSHKTIERHLTAVYRKLGLRSRTELARWFDLQSAPPPDI